MKFKIVKDMKFFNFDFFSNSAYFQMKHQNKTFVKTTHLSFNQTKIVIFNGWNKNIRLKLVINNSHFTRIFILKSIIPFHEW